MTNNYRDLNRIGKAWFVLYKYYEVVDSSETKWQNVDTLEFRKSIYEKNRKKHLAWLKLIIDADEEKLTRNLLGASVNDITKMAVEIINKMMGE